MTLRADRKNLSGSLPSTTTCFEKFFCNHKQPRTHARTNESQTCERERGREVERKRGRERSRERGREVEREVEKERECVRVCACVCSRSPPRWRAARAAVLRPQDSLMPHRQSTHTQSHGRHRLQTEPGDGGNKNQRRREACACVMKSSIKV